MLRAVFQPTLILPYIWIRTTKTRMRVRESERDAREEKQGIHKTVCTQCACVMMTVHGDAINDAVRVLGHARGESCEIILVHSKRSDGFIDLRAVLRHTASVCSIVARTRKWMLFVHSAQTEALRVSFFVGFWIRAIKIVFLLTFINCLYFM